MKKIDKYMYKNIKIDPPEPFEAKIIFWEPMQTIGFWNYPHNNAHFWRFYMNDSNGALINRIPVRTDEIVLVPPGIPLAEANIKPFRHFYIHFETGELFNSVSREVFRFPRKNFGILPEKLRLLSGMEELEYTRTVLYSAIFAALSMIPAQKLHCREKNMDVRIAAAKEFIQNHPGMKLNNANIARMAGLSTNHFIRLFRDELGLAPQQYQQYWRINLAMKYLTEQMCSIEEIADNLGFADRFHFSRVFRKLTGVSPGLYRKRGTANRKGNIQD